jgi:hypothetical protein
MFLYSVLADLRRFISAALGVSTEGSQATVETGPSSNPDGGG